MNNWVLEICLGITWGLCGQLLQTHHETKEECRIALEEFKADNPQLEISWIRCRKVKKDE